MKIGVLGFGNVASATVQKFMSNRDLIASKTDVQLEIVKVATRTVARAEGHVPEGCEIVTDCWALVDDPSIDVVIELIGGTGIAKDLVIRAITNKKHIITANKALLALYGEEIFELADQMGVCVLFEGAVAVSIPIIKTLKESVAANRVTSLIGILNGTSNYILSQMSQHGASFDEALAQAQQKGYAEADPTLDVNGEDAAHKITLLSSLAFGVPVNFSAVDFKGVTRVEPVDIAAAARLGYQLKLIAQTQLQGGEVWVSVAPTLVPNASMLTHVNGSMNGIALTGDLFGSAFLYGSGAGGVQTASAVLADLIDLAKGSRGENYVGLPNMGFKRNAIKARPYIASDARQSRFYFRMKVENKVGVLAEVSSIFASANVSVSAIFQDEREGDLADIIITTHSITTGQVQKVLPALQGAAASGHGIVIYPVLDE
ncbi:homoserine dehydrogenase [Marinobacterium sp. D7]|uniref:homoserine dehydrogenase n=1 Tax=Marinobacterium ramblicola TaxID=2849041 RepID=UPI001C2CC63B|nr:homoserine dehydrogenase [Marinobacterium ramblicola]MBV1787468.1 homoserine dehydrogenase [Marinobacterium ramblicola]